MGIMYAMQCDICEEIQVKKNPTEIKGKTYTEDGITKFSCSVCQGKLKTALALGKGMNDPLKAAAGLLEQKDEQLRLMQTAHEAKSGGFMGVADELRRKKERGGFIPVTGLDFESQYRAAKGLPTAKHPNLPALPAPKSKKKGKK